METTTAAAPVTTRDTGKLPFKIATLKEFPIINSPVDKIVLEVLHSVTEKNLIVRENGRASYVISLKAIAEDKLPLLIEKFTDIVKNNQEALWEDTNGFFMTVNAWINDGERPSLPMKGEKINCSINWVDNQDKTSKVLRVIAYSLNPAVQPKLKFDLASIGLDGVQAETLASAKPASGELVH